jgi:hypothetical protein
MRSVHTRTPLPDDIATRVSVEFGDQAGEALRLLENIRGHMPERARSLRCVVYLADGDVRLLPMLIDQALADYRDVIFWAEYTNLERPHPKRVRDFSKPFGMSTTKATRSQPDGKRLPSHVWRYFEARLATTGPGKE